MADEREKSGVSVSEIKRVRKEGVYIRGFIETCISLFLFLLAGTLAMNGCEDWGYFFVAGVFMLPTSSSFYGKK